MCSESLKCRAKSLATSALPCDRKDLSALEISPFECIITVLNLQHEELQEILLAYGESLLRSWKLKTQIQE